jgi:hypothetical protein
VIEEGTEDARALWASADSLTSSRVLHVEGYAALAAARRARRLSDRALARVKSDFESRLEEIDLVELRQPVARHAGELAERHRLRALDAIHLASALGRSDPELVFASWDRELRRAAAEAGLGTAPAQG